MECLKEKKKDGNTKEMVMKLEPIPALEIQAYCFWTENLRQR